MKILSLFDGMSCGQIALERVGFKVDKYYASEIDKWAIQVTKKNYPETIQLGDITKWRDWKIEQPDIIIGGSPCQGFSIAGKQLNFNDPRSKLFFTFVNILKRYKPKYFLLENVVMKQEYIDVISGILGELYPKCVTQHEIFRSGRLEPVMINSKLVSAQNRKRLYWTNIQGIEHPGDKGIVLKDIIQDNGFGVLKKGDKLIPKTGKSATLQTCTGGNREPKVAIFPEATKEGYIEAEPGDGVDLDFPNSKTRRGRLMKNKCNTLKAQGKQALGVIDQELSWRKLTPVECERLQTVPDNYTSGVSNSQRYKMLGNGWTVDVIAHIFSYMKEPKP